MYCWLYIHCVFADTLDTIPSVFFYSFRDLLFTVRITDTHFHIAFVDPFGVLGEI